MKFTEAQQRRILDIRAHASAVLQESENSAADLIASLVQRTLDDLAVYIERNPTLNVDAALQALATAIDHVTEGATDIMLALAEEAFDVALVSGAAALNEFGVMSPDVIEAAARSFEADFRNDLITEGHAAWYERLSTEALNPRGPMRDVIDGVSVAGESWSDAAKRLANADPAFSYLPTRNIDAYARAREIVRTESTRIDNAVSVGFSESAGIKTFQNIGVGDTRQSKICRDASNEDPKSIEEWGRSRFGAPPRHPNCRCILLGVYTGFAPDESTLQDAGVIA